MATRKFHHHHDQRPKFLYLGGVGGGADHRVNPVDHDDGFEMNESDMWNTDDQVNTISSRKSKFPLKTHHHHHQQRKVPMAKSLPVNVPDWSKILRDEYKHHGSTRDDDYDHHHHYTNYDDYDYDNDNDNEKLPPHEYLARTRIASFSVHEGIGRTLKGRDLSRVRNAIWKQTGFEQG